VSLLEGHDSAAALRCFLSARQQWAQQQLEQAAQGAAGDPPGVVLATLAQAVQSCVAQVSGWAQQALAADPGSMQCNAFFRCRNNQAGMCWLAVSRWQQHTSTGSA